MDSALLQHIVLYLALLHLENLAVLPRFLDCYGDLFFIIPYFIFSCLRCESVD